MYTAAQNASKLKVWLKDIGSQVYGRDHLDGPACQREGNLCVHT